MSLKVKMMKRRASPQSKRHVYAEALWQKQAPPAPKQLERVFSTLVEALCKWQKSTLLKWKPLNDPREVKTNILPQPRCHMEGRSLYLYDQSGSLLTIKGASFISNSSKRSSYKNLIRMH